MPPVLLVEFFSQYRWHSLTHHDEQSPGARAVTTSGSSVQAERQSVRRHRRHTRPVFATARPRRFRPRLELVEDRTLLSTFAVTNTSDDGPGSLRQAILDSNAATGQTNTIDFTIPGEGVQTIA